MTKFEWERQLKKGISGLPDSEQQRVLEYYGELFSDKIDAGMSEKEIVAEFGNPYDVANKILVDFYNDGKNNPKADEYIYSSPDSIEETDEETSAAQPTAVSASAENEKAGQSDDKPRQQGYGAKSEQGKKHNVKVEFHSQKGRKSFGGLVTLICTLIFFVLGAFFGLWHPAWMVFLLIPVVITLIEAIEKRNWQIFCYPVLVVIIFLLCGFYGRLWDPMWVLFITIPLYYVIGSYISKNVDSDDEDGKDDEEDKADEIDVSEKPSENATANSQSTSDNNKSANGSSGGSAKGKFNGAAQDKSTNVGRVIAGVLLTIVLVYVMIVVWSAVVGLFCAGLGMLCSGLVVLISSFASFAADVFWGILVLGAALVLIGLGLVFTFGMASVFKYCVKMCKQFGKTISSCFDAKE